MDWRIIDKSLQGTLTDAEKSQLNEWLEEAASHRKLYEKIRNKKRYDPGEERFVAWQENIRIGFRSKIIESKEVEMAQMGECCCCSIPFISGWSRMVSVETANRSTVLFSGLSGT